MNTLLQAEAKSITMPVPVSTQVQKVLRRKCSLCKEDGQNKRLMPDASRGASPGIPTIVHEALSSPGQPLDPNTLAFMEPRFGHDLGRVRIHTDARAEKSVQAINAQAYTVGSDIAFAPGSYSPGSVEGRRLLAHELTHVIQQRSGLHASSGGKNQDIYESEANQAAYAVTRGTPVPMISTGGLALRMSNGSGDASSRASRAELTCDMTTLCQMRFSNPDVVSRDRVFGAYRACNPGTDVVIRDPCLFPSLSLSDLQNVAGGSGPFAPQPASGAPASGGISLPSTDFRFNLGPAAFNVSIPSSVSATLPIPFRNANIVVLNLTANVSGEFSFSVTINAVPHVQIIARAGVQVAGQRRATAGLVIQTTSTTCQAVDEAAARSMLQRAGEKLRDAIRDVQNPPPSPQGQSDTEAQLEAAKRWAAVGAAIGDVNSAIERTRAGCREVPLASLEFGARIPLEPFTPTAPPTEAERGLAPYAGVTTTLHF